MIINNHKNFRDRLSIDYQYQSINWYRVLSIVIDCHRLSISTIVQVLILNYLRTGQLVVPEDKIVRKELLTEAEFYQVQGIIDELKASPFEDSTILSTEHRQTLTSWLKHTLTSAGHTYSLIYRASRNGWAASNFHSFCDRKGPTVVVVKSGNYIFGGYTEQHWECKWHSGTHTSLK